MGVELANHNHYAAMEVGEDFNFTDSELVIHVRRALQSVSLGDSDSYNQLVGVLHHNGYLAPEEVALLVTSLKAISGAVSHLDYTHHESLLSCIFSMSLWNYGPDVMDALIQLIVSMAACSYCGIMSFDLVCCIHQSHFIMSMAACSGKYVDSCLEMLVSNFVPPIPFLEQLSLPRGVSRKEQVLERVHSALRDIAHLVPLAPARLLPIIRQRMPDYRKKEPLLVLFVENVLKLESSSIGPLIGSTMLIMGVVDRLIELDCEIGWDDILSEEPTKGIFELELEEEETLAGIEEDGSEFPGEYFCFKSLAGNVTADKLDSLMVLTFDHIKFCNDNGRLVEVFESLLQSFQITILNAYKSKFAQFVMFYTCSLDPENCGVRFAQFLADVFTSINFPLLTRMSAVAYLASYMARAKFLAVSVITSVLERIVHWCSEYSQSHVGELNPRGHRAFYAGCQAIMYILCFRMRLIMENPRLKSQLVLMPLGRILKNSMDPLKVCLPSIVDEFIRQAKAAHLLDGTGAFVFSDVLESEFSRAYGGVERLDMFFPFDPCLLKKCDSFIRPIFIYWSMVRTMCNEDEHSSEEEDLSDDEADAQKEGGSPEANLAESYEVLHFPDDFNDSLNKMSITPRDSTPHLKLFGEKRFGVVGTQQMPSRLRPSTSPPDFF